MECRLFREIGPANGRSAVLIVLTLVLVAVSVSAQEPVTSVSAAPTPTRTIEHRRIAQTQASGRRVPLKSLNGAQLFVGPGVDLKRRVPLIIHFHGAAWLIEAHISQSLPGASLITVNLGSGSSVYGRPFERENAFIELVNEAERELSPGKGWSSITLTGFSAGYGAIRAILRHDRYFALVNNVLLLDGIHADYVPEGRTIADGGAVDALDVDAFVKFGSESARGRKNFVVTHSQIAPGTYASTTECVDHLLGKLGLKRKGIKRSGPGGMEQLSAVDKKGFHVRGFAGDTAPDHVDHLHEMPAWFGLLGLKHKE